jgi:hypothetical protein
MKICIVTASLGNFDTVDAPVKQSVKHDYHVFNDENFPPRFNAMTPRLQSKIPKFFAWQMLPGYDYYLWTDGNITIKNPDTVKYFLEQIGDCDIIAYRHHRRPDIRQEHRYTRKGVKQTRIYLFNRYQNELYNDLYKEIKRDTDYKDDYLLMGGVFMYKNTPKVHEMLKNWWYFNSRYVYQDQLSFPYVIRKADLKIKILDEDLHNNNFYDFKYHRRKK